MYNTTIVSIKIIITIKEPMHYCHGLRTRYVSATLLYSFQEKRNALTSYYALLALQNASLTFIRYFMLSLWSLLLLLLQELMFMATTTEMN